MIKEYYGEKRFEVNGYYDDRYRGLADSDKFDDFDDALDYAHTLLMDGNNVLIIDTNTGNEVKISADEYQDNFDGEFAVNSAIYDFEQSIWNSYGESRNRTMSKRRMTEVNKGYSSEVYQILDDTFVSEWDNTVDPDYIADDVDISLFNNGDMYDALRSTRRKATSVAYEALLYVLQCAVKDAGSRVRVTSEMAKQWLKKHSINYIDLLKPVVDHIEKYRAELKAEQNESLRSRKNKKLRERRLSEAESYGWVVEDWEARDAYDFALEYFDKEDLDYQILKAMGTDELASCMAYIFRENDLQEWDEYRATLARESFKRTRNRKLRERRLSEAESYGWVVESWEAWKAYDFAVEYLGKEYVDDEIIQCISNYELAACLAHIFRVNNFEEWDAHKNGEDYEY